MTGAGGIWGAIAGQGTQALGESISNVGSWWHARQLNKKARSDWRKSLQRGPSYWRQGLERAGINPIYVFGSGSFPGTAMSLQGQTPAARGGSGANFAQNARAASLMDQERRTLQAQEGLANANAAARVGEIAEADAIAQYFGTPEGMETAKEGARRRAMGLNTFQGAMLSAIFSFLEKEGGGARGKSAELDSLRDWFYGEGGYKGKAPYDIFSGPEKERK